MHAISGLDRPQHGQVIIDGQDILQLKPKRVDEFRAKKIGFIFQSFFVQGNESVIRQCQFAAGNCAGAAEKTGA